MKKAVWSGFLVAAGFLLMSAPAFAQSTATGAINVTVNVNARAKLTLGAASVSFADADPDVTPTLSSSAISVDVKSRTSANGAVSLTVAAGGNLTNAATDTIAISNLTWTATGTNFVAGTSSTTAQTLGSWTGSGNRSGTHTYSLPNSWAYATGAYTATLTYTLTAP